MMVSISTMSAWGQTTRPRLLSVRSDPAAAPGAEPRTTRGSAGGSAAPSSPRPRRPAPGVVVFGLLLYAAGMVVFLLSALVQRSAELATVAGVLLAVGLIAAGL